MRKRTAWTIGVAWVLVAGGALALAAPSPERSAGARAFAWHPRPLFHLRPGAEDIAFDGARAGLVTRAPGPRFEVRTLSGGLLTRTALPAAGEFGIAAFGGTSAVINQITGLGNSEIAGRWLLLQPSSPMRVLRRYHSTHEGAGGACCAVITGSGVAAQGTIVAYALLGVAYRADGARSVAIAHGVTHVWAVNARRILVEHGGRTLAVMSPAGATLRVLAAGSDPASSIAGAALQGDRAVIVRRSPAPGGGESAVLDVYRLSTGARTGSWPLGDTAGGSVTLSGAIAVALQVGRRPALLLDVTTGRHTTAPVASPIGQVRLRPDGLVYGGGDGHNGLLVRLLPTAQLRAALASAPA
jgi:hypothetical protein